MKTRAGRKVVISENFGKNSVLRHIIFLQAMPERAIVDVEDFCGSLLYTANTLKRVAQNLLLVLFKFSVEADPFAEKIRLRACSAASLNQWIRQILHPNGLAFRHGNGMLHDIL